MLTRVEKVEGILQALLQFCQRNSGRLEEKARQVRLRLEMFMFVGYDFSMAVSS